jgi:hypothetical protein
MSKELRTSAKCFEMNNRYHIVFTKLLMSYLQKFFAHGGQFAFFKSLILKRFVNTPPL